MDKKIKNRLTSSLAKFGYNSLVVGGQPHKEAASHFSSSAA
ncbi:hypothetical protein NHP190002_14650 [Helicobacter ailurogastricus]|nr:hypothetical protein NHP190002_14650 [Helicobacter ailurogastricus]